MIHSPHTGKTGWTVLAFLIGAVSLAQISPAAAARRDAGPANPLAGITVDDLSSQRMLVTTMVMTGDRSLYTDNDESSDAGLYAYESKSPKRAFLQSVLIPGWGQWYNGSRITPFVFLGLEAAGWLGVSHFHSNGNQKQGKYQRFADDDSLGWDYSLYNHALQVVYGVDSDTSKYLNPEWVKCQTDPNCQDVPPQYIPWSHHVFDDGNGNPIKNQTYYENIGKYDQFAFGWRDYNDTDSNGIGTPPTKPQDTVGVSYITQNRRNYLNQRASANREFSRASTILILTISNHLISAFEAAIGANRHNRSLDQFGAVDAHMSLVRSQTTGNLMPNMTLNYRF